MEASNYFLAPAIFVFSLCASIQHWPGAHFLIDPMDGQTEQMDDEK